MRRYQTVRVLFAASVALWALPTAAIGIPLASGSSCPDIEVIFARGTGEPPGVGWIGEAFIDSLRSKVGDRSVGVYAVDYPASYDFSNSASAGAADARARVESTSAACPETRMVLGGMSQGAGVIDLIAMDPRPVAGSTPAPMPPEVASHVAAVAVFGNPARNMDGAGPLTAISPLYGSKTIDMCAPNDIFCSSGKSLIAHFSYLKNGMVDQAASFAASRV